MLNVDELVPFLIEKGLTIEEFLILHMKHLSKKALTRAYKDKFFKKRKKMLTNEQRERLIKLGYIKKDDTVPDGSHFITEKFEELYGDSFTMAQEIWNIYPGYTSIDGKKIPLMNTSITSFREQYHTAIEGLLHEHQEVLLDTKYGVENDMICVKITNYILSKGWLQIRPFRLEQKVDLNNSPVPTQNNDYEF